MFRVQIESWDVLLQVAKKTGRRVAARIFIVEMESREKRMRKKRGERVREREGADGRISAREP